MESNFNDNSNIIEQNLKHTKCKSCGGIMNYSPSKQLLKCLYCGHEEPFDISTDIETFSYEEFKDIINDSVNSEKKENVPEVECGQCGARVSFPNNISTMKCPFCGTSLVLDDEKNERLWKPQGILPFKIEQKECMNAYSKWLKGKWFAPSKLKKELAETSGFKGVYLPYWAYNADTSTSYIGERGDNRTETIVRNGKNEKIVTTDWHYVSGNVDLSFNNVLVAASDTIPLSVRSELNEWDLQNTLIYDNKFTCGFITELYKRDFIESIHNAKDYIEDEIESEIRNDIGGDKQKISSKNITYENIMFKLMLLPVWISSYKYKGKIYQLIINGRSGNVRGDYPKSTAKIILAILLVCIIIYTLYSLSSNG
jgi:hypothetical protein